MNLIQIVRLDAQLNKLSNLLKEGTMTPLKLTQLATLAAQIGGNVGAAAAFQHTFPTLPPWMIWAVAVLNVILTLGHALLPSVIPAPLSLPTAGQTTKAGIILLTVALAFPMAAKAQTGSNPAAPAPGIQQLFMGGVSYSVGATPAVAGTGLYAHALNTSGTYAFTAIDALPNTLKPFTVSTNVGIGVAQQIFTIGNLPIFMPTAAGISWSGTNTGWQWSGGVFVPIKMKNGWYLGPSVRFLKSSVSGGTGYQPIIGMLVGWGK